MQINKVTTTKMSRNRKVSTLVHVHCSTVAGGSSGTWSGRSRPRDGTASGALPAGPATDWSASGGWVVGESQGESRAQASSSELARRSWVVPRSPSSATSPLDSRRTVVLVPECRACTSWRSAGGSWHGLRVRAELRLRTRTRTPTHRQSPVTAPAASASRLTPGCCQSCYVSMFVI